VLHKHTRTYSLSLSVFSLSLAYSFSFSLSFSHVFSSFLAQTSTHSPPTPNALQTLYLMHIFQLRIFIQYVHMIYDIYLFIIPGALQSLLLIFSGQLRIGVCVCVCVCVRVCAKRHICTHTHSCANLHTHTHLYTHTPHTPDALRTLHLIKNCQWRMALFCVLIHCVKNKVCQRSNRPPARL